jgi:hypothetical protein
METQDATNGSSTVEEFIQSHDNQKLFEKINVAYDDVLDPEEQALGQKMKSKQRRLVQEEPS